MDCEKGWNGDCCCNCTRQIKINKHPLNRCDAKGSIIEQLGWVCTAFWDMDKTEPMIFFDKEHGMCEMHNRKKDNNA